MNVEEAVSGWSERQAVRGMVAEEAQVWLFTLVGVLIDTASASLSTRCSPSDTARDARIASVAARSIRPE